MESEDIIQWRRDVWLKAQSTAEAAREALAVAEQLYVAALCPFEIGDRVTGFDQAGIEGIIEGIALVGDKEWKATIRPFKKDGEPSQKVRYAYGFTKTKRLKRC